MYCIQNNMENKEIKNKRENEKIYDISVFYKLEDAILYIYITSSR